MPSTPCPRASKWSLQALACWPAEKPLGTTISALTQAATDRYDTELAQSPRVSVGGKSPCPGDHLLRPPPSMVLGSLHLRLRRRRSAQRWCGVRLLLSLYDLSQTSPWQGMLVSLLQSFIQALAVFNRAASEMALLGCRRLMTTSDDMGRGRSGRVQR